MAVDTIGGRQERLMVHLRWWRDERVTNTSQRYDTQIRTRCFLQLIWHTKAPRLKGPDVECTKQHCVNSTARALTVAGMNVWLS